MLYPISGVRNVITGRDPSEGVEFASGRTWKWVENYLR
jgi:hypothetical protein